jgi:protein PhnA
VAGWSQVGHPAAVEETPKAGMCLRGTEWLTWVDREHSGQICAGTDPCRYDRLALAGCPSMREKALVLMIEADMIDDNNQYVYDESTGEWRPAGEVAASANIDQVEVRDAAGNVLTNGDAVTLIKDLKVKGTNLTLKQGTVIKSIRLTDNEQEIDCQYERIKGLVLRTEFVRKR